MNQETIQRLNALNREFYRVTADAFDATRSDPWKGWTKLLPYLDGLLSQASVSVLDAGCGNGRFGVFLAKHVAGTLDYHGLDSSPALLDHAREALSRLPNVTAHLALHDLIEQPPNTGDYDLVVLFGVLHHVPGAENRRALMRTLAARVKPGGYFAFTCWRFAEIERYRQRFTPFPPDLMVEPGDTLLDWRRGQRALRYCHDVDDDERAELITATGLTEIAAFRADGEENRANQYSLLQKSPQ
jgi:SAM-dependent methyltransferase